jgi:hypothetical protein
LLIAPPNCPETEAFTQNDIVIVVADAVPKDKSAVLKPSIDCRTNNLSEAVRGETVPVTVVFKEYENPLGASETC